VPIDPRLLEMLVCPACREGVALRDDGGGLECAGCGRIYPIQDDIPVMLVEKATTPTGNGSA
jgi:uncharacterized protein YbaR (Trm112 family)